VKKAFSGQLERRGQTIDSNERSVSSLQWVIGRELESWRFSCDNQKADSSLRSE
jgi:hypothetical protein